MSAVSFELEAQVRDNLGKGASRRLRRAEKVLGVVYGGDAAATPITLEQNVILKALEDEAFYSQLLKLKIANSTETVVLRDLQRHPYKPIVLHMDFQRVKATDKIHMTVPLHFIGTEECPGVAAGGVLNHLINELDVQCLAGNIPEYIEVDVSKLELDESILLSTITAPKGVEFSLLAHDHDPAVASVHMPRVAAVEEEEEAPTEETAEGEDAPAAEGGEETAEKSED